LPTCVADQVPVEHQSDLARRHCRSRLLPAKLYHRATRMQHAGITSRNGHTP
jgi:hypothetical protein